MIQFTNNLLSTIKQIEVMENQEIFGLSSLGKIAIEEME